ncbi:hypothetical protein ACFX14_002908 [Malus domestica]
MDFKAVCAAMEECQRLGLTKSIGLGSFSTKKIENILFFTTIPPYVNQGPVGAVIMFSKAKFFKRSLRNGERLSLKYVLDGCIKQGQHLLFKSYNKERLKQKFDIFDWELSEIHIEKINRIPQRKMMLREDLVSANGPSHYKSLEDLWDQSYKPFDLCYTRKNWQENYRFYCKC